MNLWDKSQRRDITRMVWAKAQYENHVYIHDIDFTRDYKGVFNKQMLLSI